MSINRAQLDGHLGSDPEIRSLNNGGRVATFRIATSERWKDKATGEQKERPEWHSIVVWPDWLVDVVERKLRKGTRVFIEGQLETREWEKDGVKRYTTEIVVRGGGSIVLPVDMPRKDGDRAPPPEDRRNPPPATSSSAAPPQRQARAADLDDDIPF